jgi:chromosome segregation ATPase
MSPNLKSKSDEQNVQLLDYSNTVNQLIDYAKKDLDNINHQIILANTTLVQLKDKAIKESNELERWKSQEKQKFNDEINKVRNDILAKQNTINLHVQQQELITRDLQNQQQKFEGLNADRIRIKEELIKIEGKKIEAQNLIKQAEDIKSEALNSRNQASMLHHEALNIQEKNKQENIRLVNLNDSIEKTRKKVEEDTKNLEGLREFVGPKLVTIKDEKDSIEKLKKENEVKVEELNRKIQEDKILLQSVLDKKSDVERLEKEFLSKKEEFQRTQLLIGK